LIFRLISLAISGRQFVLTICRANSVHSALDDLLDQILTDRRAIAIRRNCGDERPACLPRIHERRAAIGAWETILYFLHLSSKKTCRSEFFQ